MRVRSCDSERRFVSRFDLEFSLIDGSIIFLRGSSSFLDDAATVLYDSFHPSHVLWSSGRSSSKPEPQLREVPETSSPYGRYGVRYQVLSRYYRYYRYILLSTAPKQSVSPPVPISNGPWRPQTVRRYVPAPTYRYQVPTW
jgi:hypothetical protein